MEKSREPLLSLGGIIGLDTNTSSLNPLWGSLRGATMTSPFLGEFVGTLILILLGDGVVAGVLLKRSKAEASGWMVITTGWALAVMAGIFAAIACGSKDAHLNPAVTLGFAVSTGDYSKLAVYLPAQLLGALAGAVLVWLHYLPHWKETEDASLKLGVFCTAPAIRNAAANLISEIIGTFVLVFIVGAIFSKAVSKEGIGPGFGPYLVACLVWGIGLSLGGTTGYAINPARDLGPRIAHAILPIAGKRDSDWGYAGIPVVGPIVGGGLAGVLLRALHF
jgi:glycerol uptake facilitator protein